MAEPFNRSKRGGNWSTRRKPLATSFRKCHILQPEDSSPKRDSNPRSSIGARLGKRHANRYTTRHHLNSDNQRVYPDRRSTRLNEVIRNEYRTAMGFDGLRFIGQKRRGALGTFWGWIDLSITEDFATSAKRHRKASVFLTKICFYLRSASAYDLLLPTISFCLRSFFFFFFFA